MTRLDSLGVTSIIRALSLGPSKYEPLLRFFRSDAFSLRPLKRAWHRPVRKNGQLCRLKDKKEFKNTKYMQCVECGEWFEAPLKSKSERCGVCNLIHHKEKTRLKVQKYRNKKM